MRHITAVLCLCMLLGAALAQAAPKLPDIVIYTIPLDNAPVKISQIMAGWKPPDWAPAPHRTAVDDIKVLPLYIQYSSTVQKPITYVRFMTAYYDPFNDYLDALRLVSFDAIAPGQPDYGRWTCPIRDSWMTAAIIIFPVQVRFQDGTVWRADMTEAIRKSSTAGQLNFDPWQISSEPREYVTQRLKDSLQ